MAACRSCRGDDSIFSSVILDLKIRRGEGVGKREGRKVEDPTRPRVTFDLTGGSDGAISHLEILVKLDWPQSDDAATWSIKIGTTILRLEPALHSLPPPPLPPPPG